MIGHAYNHAPKLGFAHDFKQTWLGGSKWHLKVHNLTLTNFFVVLTTIKP
jgi:hypothetical protein